MSRAGPSTFGGDLVKALVGGGSKLAELQGSCRAAAALSSVLDGNSACKERVLRQTFPPPPSFPPSPCPH